MSKGKCCCHGCHPKIVLSTGCNFTASQQMDGIHQSFTRIVTIKVPQLSLQKLEIIFSVDMLKSHGIQVTIFLLRFFNFTDFKGQSNANSQRNNDNLDEILKIFFGSTLEFVNIKIFGHFMFVSCQSVCTFLL